MMPGTLVASKRYGSRSSGRPASPVLCPFPSASHVRPGQGVAVGVALHLVGQPVVCGTAPIMRSGALAGTSRKFHAGSVAQPQTLDVVLPGDLRADKSP